MDVNCCDCNCSPFLLLLQQKRVRASSRSFSGPLECLTSAPRTPLKGLSLRRLDCRPDPCSASPQTLLPQKPALAGVTSSTCPSLSLPAIRPASSTRDRLRLRPHQSLSLHAHGCCSYRPRIERSWLFHHGRTSNHHGYPIDRPQIGNLNLPFFAVL